MGMKAGRTFVVAVLLFLLAAMPAAAAEAGLGFAEGDTVKSLLGRHAGKTVTVRLGSREEMSGKVAAVGEHLVHLAELSGRELFDAAVPLDAIVAVIVRIRTR